MTLSLEQAREHVAGLAFTPAGGPGADGPGKVGLEPELFPIVANEEGVAEGRLTLHEPGGVIDVIDALVGATDLGLVRTKQEPPVYELANGGNLTFEPGGQIEHSTKVHPTAGAALDDVEHVRQVLGDAFRARGVLLAAAGIDFWHAVEDVPQQHRAPRYEAMAAYFDARGPSGRTMMRHTCSLQINVDLGPPAVMRERWAIGNLISPLVTACFSTSPCPENANARARTWQAIDPTRTGFPPSFIDGSRDEPADQWADFVLAADVMLFRRPDGSALPGVPGFTFEQWLREGHEGPEGPEGPDGLWYPTLDDLAYHMTTLFPEVRPRGFLELRSADAVPMRWRPALVVLLCGLMYDREARGRALELLEPHRATLPELWNRAAGAGLGDAELAALCRDVWTAALQGARRLPAGYFRPRDVPTAVQYLECFTFAGRAPADELRDLLETAPGRALAWAASRAELELGDCSRVETLERS